MGSTPRKVIGRPVVRVDDVELPSAIPAFLETCARLIAEAISRGDFRRVCVLTDLARQVAERGC